VCTGLLRAPNRDGAGPEYGRGKRRDVTAHLVGEHAESAGLPRGYNLLPRLRRVGFALRRVQQAQQLDRAQPVGWAEWCIFRT